MTNIIPRLSRRDFLKLFSILPLSLLPRRVKYVSSTGKGPGVIILVCDSLSAKHVSLYGYPRKTSPNLGEFAERCFVYHSHYSAGNFTVPGAASLLTGTHPWTHRAFHYDGRILASKADGNLFNLAGNDLFRLGFSQNPWADLFLYQFSKAIDLHVNADSFNLTDTSAYNGVFANDPLTSFKGLENYAFPIETPFTSSPLMESIRKIWLLISDERIHDAFKAKYPIQMPTITCDTHSPFLLEDLFAGIESLLGDVPEKLLAYLHIFPPHHPYSPRAENFNLFANDGWIPPRKEKHFLAVGWGDNYLEKVRREYDAYVSTTDAELGSFFDFLSDNGILDNNYFIITADHGEMFERGESGHTTPMLFEPLVRIPLLISAPGQTQRVDITEPTSCVDVLPTILSILGKPIPQTLEGRILPGFAKETSAEPRPVYFMDMKHAAVREPISEASIGMRKGRYKLIRYYSETKEYPKSFELYDVESDPEELHDLGETDRELAASLMDEMDKKLTMVNQPYIEG